MRDEENTLPEIPKRKNSFGKRMDGSSEVRCVARDQFFYCADTTRQFRQAFQHINPSADPRQKM